MEDDGEGASRAAGDGDRGGLHQLALTHWVNVDGGTPVEGDGDGAHIGDRAETRVQVQVHPPLPPSPSPSAPSSLSSCTTSSGFSFKALR
jgi:hypothetical protein